MISIVKALLMKEIGHQIRDFEVVKITVTEIMKTNSTPNKSCGLAGTDGERS